MAQRPRRLDDELDALLVTDRAGVERDVRPTDAPLLAIAPARWRRGIVKHGPVAELDNPARRHAALRQPRTHLR